MATLQLQKSVLTPERAYWLAWAQIPHIGAVLMQRLQRTFGSLSAAWEANSTELARVQGLGGATLESVLIERRKWEPEALLQQHLQKNPHFWTPADADYPQLLREIPDPPPILYYRGKVEPLENQGMIPAIAIVGTRTPSNYGKLWTRKFSKLLTEAGFTVVSGLAAGVDTEAHTTCIKANGRTIAVLGTGVNMVYPRENLELAQQIVETGLLLSEYPAGTPPNRVHFPRRNRIIAGLSRATLVLEAPEKSGALITARLANDYNRDVYALPGSLSNPQSKGCLGLLNQGAQLILGEAELLEALSNIPQLHASTQLSLLNLVPESEALPSTPIQLHPELNAIFQAIAPEPTAVDRIVQETGQSPSQVLSALAQLELMGVITQLPGMRYQRES
ncbi:MAG: DNA-processing protein DprA [Oculatellaceae cyanobacterium Prado106]|nr:DNA-processing protein DprA [Oculatellaceae cyanobacterium Prado106]